MTFDAGGDDEIFSVAFPDHKNIKNIKAGYDLKGLRLEVEEANGLLNLTQLLRTITPPSLCFSALNVSSFKRRTNAPISAVETSKP